MSEDDRMDIFDAMALARAFQVAKGGKFSNYPLPLR